MPPGTSSALNESLTFVEGDTWGGIPSIAITVLGSPPGSDVASAKMQFRPAPDSSDTILELSSSDVTQINITSAPNWTFIVPVQDIALAAGSYSWGFQTVDIAGVIQTYLEGTMTVLPKSVY